MTIPIIPPHAVVSPLERGMGIPIGAGTGEAPFSDMLKHALGDVVGMQQDKEQIIGRFLRGEPVELHQVMAAAEEASLSLEILVETRNKLTDAYKSVMNMQA